jgi:CheY-like chemotaxis protein
LERSAGKDFATAPKPAQAVCSILVVEDCDLVLTLFRSSLASQPYLRVAEATTTAEALKIAEQGPHVAILICDLLLPDGFGTRLALDLITVYPSLKILFVSGTPIEHWPDAARQELMQLPAGCWQWLAKPFYPQALTGKIGELRGGGQ